MLEDYFLVIYKFWAVTGRSTWHRFQDSRASFTTRDFP